MAMSSSADAAWRGGYYGGGWRGGYYGGGWRGGYGGWYGPGAGFVAGALIGGALAAPYGYYPYASPYYGPGCVWRR